MEKEETNFTNSFCLHGKGNNHLYLDPASDHPLDMGEAPIMWKVVKKGHLLSVPTPRQQPQACDLGLAQEEFFLGTLDHEEVI